MLPFHISFGIFGEGWMKEPYVHMHFWGLNLKGWILWCSCDRIMWRVVGLCYGCRFPCGG